MYSQIVYHLPNRQINQFHSDVKLRLNFSERNNTVISGEKVKMAAWIEPRSDYTVWVSGRKKMETTIITQRHQNELKRVKETKKYFHKPKKKNKEKSSRGKLIVNTKTQM